MQSAEVLIVDEGGKGLYLVNEPETTPEVKQLYKLLMASLYYSVKPTAEAVDPIRYIEENVKGVAAELKMSDVLEKNLGAVKYFIQRDMTGYGILDVAMKDPRVEEVECGGFNAPVTVVHREYTEYLHLETNVWPQTEEKVREIVQKFAQRAGKPITVAYPFTDFLLPEGHRGAVTYSSEVSLPGSTFDIRKFPAEPMTVTQLLASGTLSPLLVAYYWLLQEHRAFSFIIGPVGTGKTTTLNVLLSILRPDAKILTVEDTPELRIEHKNWVRFITRSSYSFSGRDVGLFDLVKLSLRYRPDYLVLGEVRGEEVQSLVQAAAVGHGALTTFHADSAQSALVRLMAPPLSVGESFILLIWSFLRMASVTTKQGTQVRRAVESVELVQEPSPNAPYRLKQLFRWKPGADAITPGIAEELVTASSRLEEVRDLRGWTRQDLLDDLKARKKLLEGLVADRAFKFAEVSSRISSFYQDGGKTGKDGGT